MNVYNEDGYVDIPKIIALDLPFLFLVGGRAIGKTYGVLEYLKETLTQFLLMRRTQTKTDLINKPEFSPFKQLNKDHEWNVVTRQVSKWNAGFYVDIEEGGFPLGYTCALSTLANMRGFDLQETETFVYDEFIPEKHERPIKHEARALFNAYETVNRNRELQGKKPLQLICLANADDLANEIFLELKLVRITQKMKAKGQNCYINRERGIGVFMFDDSPISKQKENTALYKLTKDTEFKKMSINNEFSGEVSTRIKSRSLKEFRPIVLVGELCIYEHKHDHTLYASTHKFGSPPEFGVGDVEKARFRRQYMWIWDDYIRNEMEFEEYLCEVLLKKVFM